MGLGSMTAGKMYFRPEDERFQDGVRRWQGVPSVAVSREGRIFVAFYGGQVAEGPTCFVMLSSSDDNGKTFRSLEVVVEHPDPECRCSSPGVWIDPRGRLWLSWVQTHGFNDGRNGVWVSVCDDPDAETLEWSAPRRIANGMMMNKPVALTDGDWLFPCFIWRKESGSKSTEDHGLDAERFSNVYATEDEGETFSLRGQADVPNRQFDEHMVVERKDGSLWMLVRTFDGIGESFSYDKGITWTPGQKCHIKAPCSRFFITRLKSGRLLYIGHDDFGDNMSTEEIMNQGDIKNWRGRVNLTAFLSDDDGETWPYKLLLDARNDAAYPAAQEAENGYIYAVYDYERVREREILMAMFTEEDILDGAIHSENGRRRILVNKATGQPDVSH